MFERYCLPSVEAQTCQDFTWVILVDHEADPESQSRIRGYAERLDRIRVEDIACDEPGSYHRLAMRLADGSSGRTLTSRIDSDDAVCIDYIERIQAAAGTVPDTDSAVIIFTRGYELSDGKLYWRPFPASPFTSLVEPAGENALTVMVANHEQMPKMARTIEIADAPGWVQVIHGENVINRVRGVRVPRNRLAQRFVIEDPTLASPESAIGLVVGIPASWVRLTWDLLTNPRYLRKAIALLQRRR